MRTKLEAIAGYLAGREPEAGPIRGELGDPSSEASLFLEATRAKSRALLAEPPGGPPAAAPPGRPAGPRGSGVLVVLGCLLAVAALLWVDEVRLRRLEARLGRDRLAAEAGLRASEDRLAKALEGLRPIPQPGPPPSREPAIEAAVARLQAAVDAMARRPEATARPAPGPAAAPASRPPDPALEDLRAQLVLIRREAAANELAGSRQIQELRTVVNELNEGLRRLLTRAPGGGARPPEPLLLPGPN